MKRMATDTEYVSPHLKPPRTKPMATRPTPWWALVGLGICLFIGMCEW